MASKKKSKHIVQTVRKPMPKPTKVESNPKKQASKNACRKKEL